jgi:hypothetical protein
MVVRVLRGGCWAVLFIGIAAWASKLPILQFSDIRAQISDLGKKRRWSIWILSRFVGIESQWIGREDGFPLSRE